MLKNKKIPTRMCVGCREMKPKKDLIRVVKTEAGVLEIDFTGKKNGRGAYICPSQNCLKIALKQKQLQRALDQNLSKETEESLILSVERREAEIEKANNKRY